VEVLLAYLSRRGGPLFQWENGLLLTNSKFVTFISAALEKAGLAAKDFSSHSFRIWAAITAAMSGLEDSTIQTLGRWKSTAFKLYVRSLPCLFGSNQGRLSSLTHLTDITYYFIDKLYFNGIVVLCCSIKLSY